jgi:predicted RND superfamily exporter protein
MKSVARVLSAAVRRFPWLVIVATVVVALVMASFASGFQPGENSSEGFAPDAPELVAAGRISEAFGGDSHQSIMQIIVTSESGDVITVDGLAATETIAKTILGGSLSPYLVVDGERPPVTGYLAPVQQAILLGAPVPASDAELKGLYRTALEQMPDEQKTSLEGLLPASADRDAMVSPGGLMLSFSAGNGFEDPAFIEASVAAADEIRAAVLPDGFTAEPFSRELLFGGSDDFKKEISSLFAAAGLIILLVLAIVFLVLPVQPRNKVISVAGIASMVGAVTLLVLPNLAKSYTAVFPESIAEWDSGGLLLGAAAVFALVFIVWSVATGRLRRTVADTLLTLVGIAFAIMIMNGFGYLIYGVQGQMTQILPILLIGLGVDYSIHILTRYREETSTGEPVAEAIGVSIRTVGVALVLATITTAVGFLTNMTSAIPALREFGSLAAIGIVASFVIMLTFVPAVRLLLDRSAETRGTLDRESLRGGEARFLPRLIGKTAWLAKHAAVPTIVVAIALGALGTFGTLRLEAKFSFLDFIPTTSPERVAFQTLLDDYAGGFGETTKVLIEGDVATPEAYNAMVDATFAMTGTPNVVQFGPLPAAGSPVAMVFQLANPQSPDFVPAVAQVAAAQGMTAMNPKVSADADIGALYDALFSADPEGAAKVLVESDGEYDVALFTVQTQAGEAEAPQLAEDLSEDFAPVADAGLDVTATSDEIISDVVVTTLQASQVSSLIYTLVAVLLLLVANFWFEVRRPLLGVITTLPVMLVVVTAFGLMWALGIPFGPITATVAALAVGIGIPYMIHVTHRYEEDRIAAEDENAAIELTLTHTGGALAGSALTTIFGFGILMTSTTIPFRQFGFVTAYTILLSLLAATLVLPSMLVVWDRWHRRKGDQALETERVEHALGDA